MTGRYNKEQILSIIKMNNKWAGRGHNITGRVLLAPFPYGILRPFILHYTRLLLFLDKIGCVSVMKIKTAFAAFYFALHPTFTIFAGVNMTGNPYIQDESMRITKDNLFEFVRFGLVGSVATAIHFGVYNLLKGIMDLSLAYTIGYIVSFIVNYLLSARFTFKKKTSVKNGFGFGGAHVFNYLLQMGLLHLFLYIGVKPWLAPVPVYCIAIPTNFLIVRFVFRRFK